MATKEQSSSSGLAFFFLRLDVVESKKSLRKWHRRQFRQALQLFHVVVRFSRVQELLLR